MERARNQNLCENGENKVIRHFSFTGPYLGTWKLVSVFNKMAGKWILFLHVTVH